MIGIVDSWEGGKPPSRLVLDIDTTDDEVHGRQEGRYFHDGVDAPSRLHRDVPRWY